MASNSYENCLLTVGKKMTDSQELDNLFEQIETNHKKIVNIFHEVILTSVGKGDGYFVYTNSDRVVLYHIKSIIKIEETNILVCLEKVEIWKDSFGEECGVVYSSYQREPLFSLICAVTEKEDKERAFGDNLPKELFDSYKNKALNEEALNGTFEDTHLSFWKIASESEIYKIFVETLTEITEIHEFILSKRREESCKSEEKRKGWASKKLVEIISQKPIGKFAHFYIPNRLSSTGKKEYYGIIEKVSLGSYYNNGMVFSLLNAFGTKPDENSYELVLYRRMVISFREEDIFEYISEEEYNKAFEKVIEKTKVYIGK